MHGYCELYGLTVEEIGIVEGANEKANQEAR